MFVFDFRENRTKVNMDFNNNDTITYMQLKSWHFDPALSNGSLYDQVTTVNIVLNVSLIILSQHVWLYLYIFVLTFILVDFRRKIENHQ